ncbi:MAG: hypothetical protein DMD47_10220, partial [Gemmatimonadetes bacterium]
MSLRDVVLFNITAIVGLRWLTTAGRIGPASLALWVIAMVIFFLPSAMAVRELTDIDPGEGGIYRWATRAFGPRHGFLAGWGYWVNNLVYYPSLLLTSGAIVAYVGGAGFVHLAENKWFIAAFSLANLWIAVGLNLVGLRVGKWVQNLGAYGTWLPAAIFVLLALWSFATHGSATPFTARALVPTHLDLPLLSLFATMTFAFAGLELAPTLGDEIRDPVATLRRGIVLSGIGVVAMYLLGTAAMLVALPAEAVSVTNGMPQATAVLVARLGAAWLAPAAALVAALLTLQNLGAYGTWLPAAIFVLLALWSFATHGSATPFTARALVPTHLDLPLLSLFATMTFAFAGLELAPTLGDEIRDPVATLRRGIVLSGIGVVAMYLLGTAAMLVALPAEAVSVTNGMPQATAVLVARLGAAWLAPAAALVAA